MASIAKIGIKPTITQQLPDFVVDDHPIFVAFMEAYFEFVERENAPMRMIRTMKDFIDSDEMLGSFITSFYEEMKGLPSGIIADKQLLAKHIYELYAAKGTAKSYELLFRLMFGESCSVYLPSDDMIRVSGGTWTRSIVIRTTVLSGNPFGFIGNKINQYTDGVITATAVVEDVKLVNNESIGYYDLYLAPTSILGKFSLSSEISGTGGSLRIVNSPKVSAFKSRGSSYHPGQTVSIIGSDGQGCVIEVDTVSTGGIDGVFILNGGTGYTVGDILPVVGNGSGAILKVSKVSGGVITEVKVWNKGQGYSEQPKITSNGLIIPYGFGIGSVTKTTVRNPGFGYTSRPLGYIDTNVIIQTPVGEFIENESLVVLPDTIIDEHTFSVLLEDGSTILSESSEDTAIVLTIYDIQPNYATIGGVMEDIGFLLEDGSGFIVDENNEFLELELSTFPVTARTIVGATSGARTRIIFASSADFEMELVPITELSGRYKNANSKISESGKRIQDSDYYQDFSYVIRSGLSIDKYRNAVAQLLHPVGTKMFGAIDIESRVSFAIKTVGALSNAIRQILFLRIPIQMTVAEHLVTVKWATTAEMGSTHTLEWLDTFKFSLGSQAAGVIGTHDTQKFYRPEVIDNGYINNTSSSVFDQLTFDAIYQYSIDPDATGDYRSLPDGYATNTNTKTRYTWDSIITKS